MYLSQLQCFIHVMYIVIFTSDHLQDPRILHKPSHGMRPALRPSAEEHPDSSLPVSSHDLLEDLRPGTVHGRDTMNIKYDVLVVLLSSQPRHRWVSLAPAV